MSFKFNNMQRVCFYVLLLLCLGVDKTFLLSCKDDNNNDVDWFFLYKFPKIADNSANKLLSSGTEYVYITSDNIEQWKQSEFDITSKESMLGRTWKDLKMNEHSSAYLFYNDEAPTPFNGATVGHLKGFFAFNEESGYWLLHSVPGFGVINDYNYPESGVRYGQYAFCVTYSTSQLNDICNHLLYCNPNIYQKRSTKKVLDLLGEKAKTLFTDKPAFIHHPPFLRISKLTSRDGHEFTSFAKDNQLNQDLYSDIIAPNLKTSLLTETWRRGSGHYLDPSCEGEFFVLDVTEIDFSASMKSGEEQNINFKSNEDHSKWAVSSNPEENWICSADLNRMESQEKRGGGAVCFQSSTTWRQLRNIIKETDKCPT